MKIENPKSFLLKNRRFDLFIKYLFLRNREFCPTFFDRLYLEHIKAFNNFNEDHGRKRGKHDFFSGFLQIHNSIAENGFDEKYGKVPINTEDQLIDGAHRIACCAHLNVPFITETCNKDANFDYDYFLKKNFPSDLADYTALEYVKSNVNAYIVNIHAVNDVKYDNGIEKILNKYGFIFYKKSIFLNYNAYVSLKIINYGAEHWNKNTFVGNYDNDFQGAKEHAQHSFGKYPLRAYIFVCDSLEKVLEAKIEIRQIFKLGNHSIHINDSHNEAIHLSEVYFNDNSIHFLNNSPYNLNGKEIDKKIYEFKEWLINNSLDPESLCLWGSLPLALYNLRQSNDLDFIFSGIDIERRIQKQNIADLHNDRSNFPIQVDELVFDPHNYFYYKGMKVVTLDILRDMKIKRAEYPKDIHDIILIDEFKKNDISFFIMTNISRLKIELRLFAQNPIRYFYYKMKSNLARITLIRQAWIRLKGIMKP